MKNWGYVILFLLKTKNQMEKSNEQTNSATGKHKIEMETKTKTKT